MEIQRLIGRALRSVVDLERLGERTITLDCDVLLADGGTRTTAITGAFVALILACERLRDLGLIRKWPIQDWLASTSVGIVDGQVRLDLSYEEDSHALVDMNVVMTGSGKFVEIQGTGEESPFDRNQLDSLLSMAEDGIRRLIEHQRKAIGPIARFFD
jgi:ribonuclease PH